LPAEQPVHRVAIELGVLQMDENEIERWIAAAIEADPSPNTDEPDDTEAGPPLSLKELAHSWAQLALWQRPETFRELVGTLNSRSRSADFFNNQQHKFLRDAWTIAEFTSHKPVDMVRITTEREQWPDGQVQIGTALENVEVTIALAPGRKLGTEYRFPGKTELDPVNNWIERAAAIPAALEKAVSGKAAKRYGSPASLLVYLNINDYGIRQAETEAAIAEVKRRYSNAFPAIYVLWKDKLL
jgi:hypothetical protein